MIRSLVRGFGAPGAFLASMALVVPLASGVVTPGSSAGTQVFLTSDDAGDSMSLGCSGGKVRYLEGGVNLAVDCVAASLILIAGEGGVDTVDLTAMQAADFPALQNINIAGGPGADNIKGSFYADRIESDSLDTVQGFGGHDFIEGGDSVFGGEGNDILSEPSGLADGGPGNDRIINASSGPFVGGTGDDRFEFDFSPQGAGIEANFTISDTTFHLDAPGIPVNIDISSTGIEHYALILLEANVQTVSSSSYSGSVDLRGLGGVDRFVAGRGDDLLDGGEGNDELTGGAGFDVIKGGQGDDLVNSRDGGGDRVTCGDGNDTVVADASDSLTGCETVRLPPPVTGAIKGPKTVKRGIKASFTFSSTSAGAKFQCKLDARAWKSCKSPLGVATGTFKIGSQHVLRVRAVLGSVKDKTPSKKTFTIVKP